VIDFGKILETRIAELDRMIKEDEQWEIENNKRERRMMKYVPCVKCMSKLTISYVNGDLCTECRHFETNGHELNILGKPIKVRAKCKAQEFEWKQYETELKKGLKKMNNKIFKNKEGGKYSYKRGKIREDVGEGIEDGKFPVYEPGQGLLYLRNREDTRNHPRWSEVDIRAIGAKGIGGKETNGRKNILQVVG